MPRQFAELMLRDSTSSTDFRIRKLKMIELLKRMLPEIHESLLNDSDWDSLIINRRKPWTYRVFRQFGDYRVCLHGFHECDSDEAFIHPHPWTGAFLLLEGSYVQKLGFSQTKEKDSVPEFFYREVLETYSSYEILDQRIWHSVQPLTRCYTVMLNGKPWEDAHGAVRTTKGKDLEKMSEEDLKKHKNHFIPLLNDYMTEHNFLWSTKGCWTYSDCEHENLKVGPNLPRAYGSCQTKICCDCNAWRQFDWHGNSISNWLNSPIEDMLEPDDE